MLLQISFSKYIIIQLVILFLLLAATIKTETTLNLSVTNAATPVSHFQLNINER